ncbi:hypothetical protein Rhe02_38500 [Rhizocola hellebori]|uniref:Uncharacterized protein n=1 Tax=Rhizocola hellebori TaxID=1392758 RepID=A0A8J3Q9R8_9ACTN|nr:hypothetical protein [Rhizocola hellebori]GIH05783.1 hypothetical protein Rhe02_38500 [Rhizocola hellebori]
MVFIASRHPVWRMVRRSLQLLTGAVMLTAALSSGPVDVSTVAIQPPVTTAVSMAGTPSPVQGFVDSTPIHAEPAVAAAVLDRAEQPAPVALTAISVLSGRILAAALGERAPPRL